MKARNRKTGEIVDIISYSSLFAAERCPSQDYVSYIDSKGVEHYKESLNYYWDFEPIDDTSDHWHRADRELPPPSAKVFVTDGNSIEYGWYDYYRNEWRGLMTKITHWMYLPEPPKEN